MGEPRRHDRSRNSTWSNHKNCLFNQKQRTDSGILRSANFLGHECCHTERAWVTQLRPILSIPSFFSEGRLLKRKTRTCHKSYYKNGHSSTALIKLCPLRSAKMHKDNGSNPDISRQKKEIDNLISHSNKTDIPTFSSVLSRFRQQVKAPYC